MTENQHELWDQIIQERLSFNPSETPFAFFDSKLPEFVSIQPHSINTQGVEIKSTGLGLPISRLIAKALGGECSIQYDPDIKSVRFWFTFTYRGAEVATV